MPKKTRLTAQRHDEIASELYEMRVQLISLSVEVFNAYPSAGPESKFGKALSKALGHLDMARSYGEEALYRDAPDGDPYRSPFTYYRAQT